MRLPFRAGRRRRWPPGRWCRRCRWGWWRPRWRAVGVRRGWASRAAAEKASSCRPGSEVRSMASKVRSRSPTTGWCTFFEPVRCSRTSWEAHRVRKMVAAGGELADEVGEDPVVGRPAGLGAQQGDDLAGVAFPVPVERLGAGVEEGEPGRVHRPLRHDEHLGEQGGAEPVRGDRVEPAVLDEHRHVASSRRSAAARSAGPAAARDGPRRRAGSAPWFAARTRS